MPSRLQHPNAWVVGTLDQRIVISAVAGIDRIPEGESDSYRVVEVFDFADLVGDRAGEFRDALVWGVPGLGEQDGEARRVCTAEDVEVAEFRAQRVGGAGLE